MAKRMNPRWASACAGCGNKVEPYNYITCPSGHGRCTPDGHEMIYDGEVWHPTCYGTAHPMGEQKQYKASRKVVGEPCDNTYGGCGSRIKLGMAVAYTPTGVQHWGCTATYKATLSGFSAGK